MNIKFKDLYNKFIKTINKTNYNYKQIYFSIELFKILLF
jgi:hypothetical protein